MSSTTCKVYGKGAVVMNQVIQIIILCCMSLQALYPLLVDFEHLITALTAFNLSQLFNIFRKLKQIRHLFICQ